VLINGAGAWALCGADREDRREVTAVCSTHQDVAQRRAGHVIDYVKTSRKAAALRRDHRANGYHSIFAYKR
jgi:hypothetical protein